MGHLGVGSWRRFVRFPGLKFVFAWGLKYACPFSYPSLVDTKRPWRPPIVSGGQASQKHLFRHVQKMQFTARPEPRRSRSKVVSLDARPETIVQDDIHAEHKHTSRQIP